MENAKYELRALRARKNLTQEDIAKILGITTRTYASKERGEHQFTISEVYKICDYFKVSPMDIFFTNQCTEMVNL